jgi:small GTP-binding protein
MIQKKICMLGAYGVGKTSLVQRYVNSIFSDTYLTTVGVKIDKKNVDAKGQTVSLILWDIAGEDDTSTIRTSYLRGTAAYFLVVDGTRAETLDVVESIQSRVETEIGKMPFIVLLNKADLQDQWLISASRVAELKQAGWLIFPSSAKTGEGVEMAFQNLAELITG